MRSNTPDQLAAWIADPHALKPGVAMPASDLTKEELDALLAYLGSLK
jgi:cytochrome c oxidase subunit 2